MIYFNFISFKENNETFSFIISLIHKSEEEKQSGKEMKIHINNWNASNLTIKRLLRFFNILLNNNFQLYIIGILSILSFK